MEQIILYTKKFELDFNEKGVATVDVTALIEELANEYDLIDRNPTVTIEGNVQYVTLKLMLKKEKKSMGFSFGKQ